MSVDDILQDIATVLISAPDRTEVIAKYVPVDQVNESMIVLGQFGRRSYQVWANESTVERLDHYQDEETVAFIIQVVNRDQDYESMQTALETTAALLLVDQTRGGNADHTMILERSTVVQRPAETTQKRIVGRISLQTVGTF